MALWLNKNVPFSLSQRQNIARSTPFAFDGFSDGTQLTSFYPMDGDFTGGCRQVIYNIGPNLGEVIFCSETTVFPETPSTSRAVMEQFCRRFYTPTDANFALPTRTCLLYTSPSPRD